MKEIETISTIEHDYQTLVIDSISTIRDNLVDEELQKIATDLERTIQLLDQKELRWLELSEKFN